LKLKLSDIGYKLEQWKDADIITTLAERKGGAVWGI
jgi:hypothetical protein